MAAASDLQCGTWYYLFGQEMNSPDKWIEDLEPEE